MSFIARTSIETTNTGIIKESPFEITFGLTDVDPVNLIDRVIRLLEVERDDMLSKRATNLTADEEKTLIEKYLPHKLMRPIKDNPQA